MLLTFILIRSMRPMQGYNRIFGAAHIHNQGQCDTEKQMMQSAEEGGNLEQSKAEVSRVPLSIPLAA